MRVVVTSEGSEMTETAELISVSVRHSINRVPRATLVFADGDMPEQTFPLSDGAHFEPGAAIAVKAGYGNEDAQIFSGIVVRHGLSIAGNNDSRLTSTPATSTAACKPTAGPRRSRSSRGCRVCAARCGFRAAPWPRWAR